MFAGIFMAHTRTQIPTLYKMCRETLNPHISTITQTCRLLFLYLFLYQVFMTFIALLCCFEEPLGDVML